MSVKGKAAIVGIHEYEARFDPEASILSIEADCARDALEDAGLQKEDVDGLFSHRGFTLVSI